MHPLHDYVAKQLADRLKDRALIVWYDQPREFESFIAEVRSGLRTTGEPVPVSISGVSALLAEYAGSMLELRSAVEPTLSGDSPASVVMYVPGCERDRRGSVLMELEKAGECYEPQLRRFARNALRQRYTDGVIDEMLASERVTYEDLARALSDTTAAEPPSMLKGLFYDVSGNDGLLAAWLMSDSRDEEITKRESIGELVKLIRSRLGLELPEDATLVRLRANTLRYVLAGEFRSDLSCPPPPCLEGVPTPKTTGEEAALRDLASRLRTSFADAYTLVADKVEHDLGLHESIVPADCLGAIDTFRCEERALLVHCARLAASEDYAAVLQLVDQREGSFWLTRDVTRRALWEGYRRLAELGKAAHAVRAATRGFSGDVDAWVSAYIAVDGWHRLDRAQRRLETWLAGLQGDLEERALGVVRHSYDDVCDSLAQGFTKALVGAQWASPRSAQQTGIFSELVAKAPRPVAYFLVDAMRFEMGMELSERFPGTAEVSVRHALTALPSVTPVGMAALQPGASGSFSVFDQGGKLGARIEGTFLGDLAGRKKFASARVPQLVDLSLDELLSLSAARLARKLQSAQVVMVRSQELDQAGESTTTRQARRVMDEVLGDIASAVQRLAKQGVRHSIVAADHGHLFFASDRDESMRIDTPGGQQVALHRRCWIGRGGGTPPACTRVSASALGYDSDLDFVFPVGTGVFKAGGDLAYHHGGTSLQEMIIPVLSIRLATEARAAAVGSTLEVVGAPQVITNRIFTVALHGDLLAGERLVRPFLVSDGRQVGVVGMAIGTELHRETGCVRLRPEGLATVAFLLSDESVASLRVVVQDPETDAELYRSPAEIPVRLGV
jgi:hypothetical protein